MYMGAEFQRKGVNVALGPVEDLLAALLLVAKIGKASELILIWMAS